MKFKDFDEMYVLWKEAGLNLGSLQSEKEYTEKTIELNPNSSFVATEKEKIVGSVFGAFNGKRGWIYHLAVHKSWQNKGLGSLLLNKTEQALKKSGAERILLGVIKSNLKVLTFYKKHGYAKVTDAIWMGKNI